MLVNSILADALYKDLHMISPRGGEAKTKIKKFNR